MQISLQTLEVGQSDRLGLAFPAGNYETYEALADAGFGRVRIGVSWDRIQPGPGVWSYEGLDAQITILKAHGIKPLLTFYSDADWATRSGDNRALNEIPMSLDSWGAFVGKTVARYADMVDDYQVANEFAGLDNESGGWGGSPDDLIDYINTAHDAAKIADPDATFYMGGVASFVSDIVLVNLGYETFEPFQPLSPTTETRFTVDETRSPVMDTLVQSRLFSPLQQARYDVASVHLYGDRGLDALRIGMIEDITGRQVISSESGAPTYSEAIAPLPIDLFTASVMADLGALAHGVETAYWLKDYDGGTTFYNQHVPLRGADGTPKPSFWAKKLLANYLVEDAIVTAPAEGVFRVDSASEGAALIGPTLAFFEAGLLTSLGTHDTWVVAAPETGLLQRLDRWLIPALDTFIVVDTGWLAAAASEGPVEPEGVLVASSALSFLRAVTGRTKIDMSRDGEIIDQFWYTGDLILPEASLTELGLTLGTGGVGGSALGLGHGGFGIASEAESDGPAAQIDSDEFLFIAIEPTLREDGHPVVWIDAEGIEDGETVRFGAYLDGALVASDITDLTAETIRFDPGLDFDRIEMGAGENSAFSLTGLEIRWYIEEVG